VSVLDGRAPVPSEREQELGATLAPAAAPLPEQAPSVARREWLRAFARDARLRSAVGDQPLRPVLVLGSQANLKGLAAAVLGVSFGRIYVDLSVSDGAITAIAVGSQVGGALLGLAVAYLCDRTSRVRVMQATALMFALVTIYLGIVPTTFAFVVCQIGQNVFGSGMVNSSPDLSLLSDYYKPDVRGRVYAFQQVIGTLGAVVFPLAAGFLVTILDWQVSLLVGGVAALVATALFFLMREPERGRWDRLATTGTDAPPATPVRPVSLSEALRTVQSVRTLRRVCLAQAFLSASGVLAIPLITATMIRAYGTDPMLIGVIRSSGFVLTMAGIMTAGVVADRVLRERPASIMTLLGVTSLLNSAMLAVFVLIDSPWVLLPVSMVLSFVSMLPLTGEKVLLSEVVPARVRTFGIQLPQLYGLAGTIVVLPLAFALSGSAVRNALLVAVPVSMIGGVLYLLSSIDVEKDIRAAQAAAAAEDQVLSGGQRLLVCRGVDVHYESTQVLFGVDLDIDEGELVALLGTNGAGKSTLLRAISGVAQPSGGAVFFDGRDTTHAPPHELARRGVVQMPGGKGVFPTLTVADNLRIAAWSLDPADADERVAAVYTFFPRLDERRSALAGVLSGGEQQMLALGQAMVMRPRLLLIDELSLGLAPAVVEQLLQAVTRLHEDGTTIVLVEQSVDLALSVAKRAVFMEKGEVRFDGPADDLRRQPGLLRSVYLGGTRAARTAPRAAAPPSTSPVVLEVSGLSVRYGGVQALDGATLSVRAAEVVGLIGPNGAGKTTLFDAVCGFVPMSSGTVVVAGHDVTDAGPRERAERGLARSFQDARLFPALTVTDNLLLALHRSGGLETSAAMAALWTPQSRRAEAQLRRRADVLVEAFGLGGSRDKVPGELSTGTRRILDVALQMAGEPDVLLLDEPSAGIAQAEAEELGPLLDRVRRDLGCGLLVIEHDMSLLTTLCDRMVGMVLGQTVVEGTVAEVTSDPRMVAAYLGTSDRALARSGKTRIENRKSE